MSTPKADEIVSMLVGRSTKRVKIGVVDIDGVLRGKTISLDKFKSVVRESLAFCDCIFDWDTNDQLYDNAAFTGWHTGFPDAQLRLDLSTMRMLPDEENTPLFIAEVVPPEGKAFHPICPRNVLRRVLGKAESLGYAVQMGFEYEFFIFDETPRSVREKGFQNLVPVTPGMFGYSVLRSGVHSELHRGLMDYCIDLDMGLENLHTETGPGVWEASLAPDAGLRAADKAVLFKTFAKVFFQRRDLMATFMAKWSDHYPGQSGHLHQSLVEAETGKVLFHDAGGRGTMSPLMEHFVAGQLALMREFCVLAAPTINSYSRLIKGAWAPTAATWGIDNRTTAVRVIGGGEESQRAEYRLAGAEGNPYLVTAAALASGLYGIENKLTLDEPVVGNAYDVEDSLPEALQLPRNLRDASALFAGSEAARSYFGEEFVDHYVASRDWEVRQFEKAITDWELKRYFEII